MSERSGGNYQNAKNNGLSGLSRRDFLKTSVAAAIASGLPRIPGAYAAGSDLIRVGVVGCGGRGTGAAIDCMSAAEGVEIAALADLFPDYLNVSFEKLKQEKPEKLKVTPDRMFSGFDGYKKLASLPDLNLVILAAPPHFRPMHFQAAVEAGKHVFMEKPVAVDPVGVRSIIASSALADSKKLSVVAGTQRRHQARYLEVIKRIHDGSIGELVGGQCYWNQGALWVKPRQPRWSDMEWQCRNWLYFTWLSGDHIVEQHVHNIDVINWALEQVPDKVMGMGGRQARTAPEFGNIFDHFAVEYEYPNGVRVASMCRQTDGAAERVEERIVGTKGVAFGYGEIKGANPWKWEADELNPYVQEHTDLIASIRGGKPINEGKRIAESTMCAIMGRMSAYTGRAMSWDWAMKVSTLDLSPPSYEFGDLPVAPVAIPGKTPLV